MIAPRLHPMNLHRTRIVIESPVQTICGNSLCALLDWLEAGNQKETGLFATLMSSQPGSGLGIGALQEPGATYRASF